MFVLVRLRTLQYSYPHVQGCTSPRTYYSLDKCPTSCGALEHTKVPDNYRVYICFVIHLFNSYVSHLKRLKHCFKQTKRKNTALIVYDHLHKTFAGVLLAKMYSCSSVLGFRRYMRASFSRIRIRLFKNPRYAIEFSRRYSVVTSFANYKPRN